MFAMPRGVASSLPLTRNAGHMRSGAVRVRQSPHPLHRAISCVGEELLQTKRGVLTSALASGSRLTTSVFCPLFSVLCSLSS